MDVTRRNFYDLLPEFEKAIDEASFVAIDGEFTGLNSCGRELNITPFDTPQQYYEKEYQRALDFLMLQCGVCLFQYNKKENRYSYQAFNFYLFPATGVKGCSSLVFQCQSSSIAFLAKNGFDFNKAFGEGIPYMTQIAEDKMKEIMQERHNKMDSIGSSRDIADIQIPDRLKLHLERNIALIQSFLEGDGKNKEEEFVLKNCTPFLRRLLYQEVPKKFGDRIYLETQDDMCMLVARNSEGLQTRKQEERKMQECREIEDAVGFSHFVKLLSRSGKLIVGHNCLLDLCHVVNHFRYPLPADYNDFKEMMHHIFPRILDTKHMAESSEFQDVIPSSALSYLLKTLSEPPFTMPSLEGGKDQSYDLSVDKSHEAGYDAFITGLCFLSMCNYLCKEQGRSLGSLDAISDILKKFENRIYLSRIQDIPFMQLGGIDRKPPRDHVFHLTFPKEWRQSEVTELFKPFGPVSVSFLDDRSAFVALQKRNQAAIVLKTMTENSTYKLTPFSVFQEHCKSYSMKSQSKIVNPLQADYSRKRKGLEEIDASQPHGVPKKFCNSQQRHMPAQMLSTTYLLTIIVNRYYLDWLKRPLLYFISKIFTITIKMFIGLILMASVCYILWCSVALRSR